MMLGAVSDWLKKHWRKGDYSIVPMCVHSDTVGRITQLTGSSVRPIAERIEALAKEAARKRRTAPKARPSKNRGTTPKKGIKGGSG